MWSIVSGIHCKLMLRLHGRPPQMLCHQQDILSILLIVWIKDVEYCCGRWRYPCWRYRTYDGDSTRLSAYKTQLWYTRHELHTAVCNWNVTELNKYFFKCFVFLPKQASYILRFPSLSMNKSELCAKLPIFILRMSYMHTIDMAT